MSQINLQLEQLIKILPCSVYSKNVKGEYLSCNDEMAKLAGCASPIELQGKTDSELNWTKSTNELRKNDLEVINSKMSMNIEENIIFSNGENRTYLTSKTPLLDETTNEVIGVFSVSMDITQQIQAKKTNIDAVEHTHYDMLSNLSQKITGNTLSKETTLQEHTSYVIEYLESIIACMPGSIYWKDRNGIYRGGNDYLARMVGLGSRKDIIGKTDYDFAKYLGYNEEERQNVMSIDAQVMESGIPILNIEEAPLKSADGTIITQLTNKVPLFDRFNDIIGIVGISIDISDRKKLEQDLRTAKEKAEAANFIMTEFISNMGHDLAAPISDVGNIAEIFNCYSDEYPELKELIDTLILRAASSEAVRKTIINATSISNLEVNPETFSIVQELLYIQTFFNAEITAKNLQLIIHPYKPKKEELIETDRTKFHDILIALVSNAINFTGEGEITISVSKHKDFFKISIADTGIGIPADKFDYIFEQYTKLSRSNKYGATFKGVGAGLYLARIRAKILGATISVESEVGKGSIFTLSIPVHLAYSPST